MPKSTTYQSDSPTSFLQMVFEQTKKAGVFVDLVPAPQVYFYGGVCAGYFSEDRIVVALENKEWLSILAHEFGHFEQREEGLFQKDGPDVGFNEWLVNPHTKLTKQKVVDYAQYIQLSELDAERRAVGFMSRYKLHNNIPAYIRRANCYVWLYDYAAKRRCWPMMYIAEILTFIDKIDPAIVPDRFTATLTAPTKFIKAIDQAVKKDA
jgi:hypothetical protein